MQSECFSTGEDKENCTTSHDGAGCRPERSVSSLVAEFATDRRDLHFPVCAVLALCKLPCFGIVWREHQRESCTLGLHGDRPSTTSSAEPQRSGEQNCCNYARAGGATSEMSSVALAKAGELAELGGIELISPAPSELILAFALL